MEAFHYTYLSDTSNQRKKTKKPPKQSNPATQLSKNPSVGIKVNSHKGTLLPPGLKPNLPKSSTSNNRIIVHHYASDKTSSSTNNHKNAKAVPKISPKSKRKLSWNDNPVSKDLIGFRIVQNGVVIHDQLDDDDSCFELSIQNDRNRYLANDKFASSLMCTGPGSKEISLPQFLEIDEVQA